jgi:hypothetical protein
LWEVKGYELRKREKKINTYEVYLTKYREKFRKVGEIRRQKQNQLSAHKFQKRPTWD